MNHETPLSPRPLQQFVPGSRRLLTTAQLRARGVAAAETTAHCRPDGPWQQILPGVVLLHPDPPTGEERLHAVLLYVGRERNGGVPSQPGPRAGSGLGEAVITGLAALALHGFASTPPLADLEAIDVLVPRPRRLRSAGCARILRTSALPEPELVTVPQAPGSVRAGDAHVPVAPVARALADAVAELTDASVVRRLLTEAVRGGHCEPAAVVRELTEAHLLSRPHVVDAVESLLAEGRAIAEDRLYRMVREYGLPDPVWNVGLRLPGGPDLGGVDAYWPDHAVAVDLDMGAARHGHATCGIAGAPECPRKREHLERLGITVVRLSPRQLRDAPEHQAAVVRTALMAAADREPAAYVVALPRL
ncbi:hypothetical protein AB0L74_33005 [Streptomyces sp. NPDC052020]|uniref:hypothetical protein n=1 Tax=Streptomyces sp. NPDC052020 TaxID=3155677 RepID=UPI00342566C3